MSNSFATPWTVACQVPLSMGLSRQEYWSGLPFPSQGDLPNSGIQPGLLHWQVDSLPLSHVGSQKCDIYIGHKNTCIYLFIWASLIALLVKKKKKNAPAMPETLVQFLGQEDPLEKGWATHSSVLGLPLWLSW